MAAPAAAGASTCRAASGAGRVKSGGVLYQPIGFQRAGGHPGGGRRAEEFHKLVSGCGGNGGFQFPGTSVVSFALFLFVFVAGRCFFFLSFRADLPLRNVVRLAAFVKSQ